MAARNVDILLVEDNPHDEMMALRALKNLNHAEKIYVVRDGAEALDFVFCTGTFASRQVENPKVILLDKKMPFVDGLEVLRKIRADARTQSTPVVMLTASAEICDKDEAYKLGANSYVVKQLDFVQFTETIGKVADYWLHINQHPGE